jgi:hypothetical protein
MLLFPLICIFSCLAKERASGRLDQSTSQLVSSNSANTESLRRPRLSENERLPGAVLLARERLLERLRGVPLPGNRSVLTPTCMFVIFLDRVWISNENSFDK